VSRLPQLRRLDPVWIEQKQRNGSLQVATVRAGESLQAIQSGKHFPNNWPVRDAFLQSTAKLIEGLDVEFDKLVQELEQRK